LRVLWLSGKSLRFFPTLPANGRVPVTSRIAQQWGNTFGFIEWFDKTYGFDRGCSSCTHVQPILQTTKSVAGAASRRAIACPRN
jgi:hypothetical protein